MIRCCLVGVAVLGLVAPSAQAASPYAKASLLACDKELREATFQGRVISVRRTAKMQMRFTLQAQTPGDKKFHKVDAPGFGTWITIPPGFGKYTYDKTVQDLLPPASYRAVVHFRWRDARGKVIRSESSTSAVCRLPDDRPDLVVRSLQIGDNGRYIALIFNRGREAAGAFAVDVLRDGAPLGRVEVPGLAPMTSTRVVVPGIPCVTGERIEAVADPRSEVDEANEENGSLSVTC